MLGTRLRQVRQSRRMSLNDVASRAKISVATLSRIERDKQGVDLEMFMLLSRILKVPVHDLIAVEAGATNGEDDLASRIFGLSSRERIAFWHDLAGERSKDRSVKRVPAKKLADQVDELIAQMEFLHSEIESMQKRLRGR